MNWSELSTLPENLREQVRARFSELPLASEEDYAQYACELAGVPYLDVLPSQVDRQLVDHYTRAKCEEFGFLPLFRSGILLVCALTRPWSSSTIAQIRQIHYDGLRVVGVSSKRFRTILNQLDELTAIRPLERREHAVSVQTIHGWNRGNDPELVRQIVRNAYALNASDIHFEPQRDRMIVRYRINGVLVIQDPIEERYISNVIDSLKNLAMLPLGDRSRPRDGRFTVNVKPGHDIDLRMVNIPVSNNRENVVLRLLDPDNIRKKMGKLPFRGKMLDCFRLCMDSESGLVILTGPTGSGKTTTLYTALTSLPLSTLSVRTVEDPIEYPLDKIIQTAIDAQNGLTFASALRYILRADPDVIMVGEIRDAETAELASSAANTGHLVLSTLHTNDAPSTVSRLHDLGLTHQMISQVLTLSIAQRLVPTLCPKCRYETSVPKSVASHFLAYDMPPPIQLFKANGCERCQNGVAGRAPVFQFFHLNPEIRQLVSVGTDDEQLRKQNNKYYPSLIMDSLDLVSSGQCDYDSVKALEGDIALLYKLIQEEK